MAPFTLIFTISLIVNITATFRSSRYWNKWKHYFGFPSTTSTSSLATTNKDTDIEENSTKNRNESKDDILSNAAHTLLLRKYLIVYLLAALSDWLQGPYVYALYDAYGYSQHAIAILFVAGFGSSMIAGTFVGGFADSAGRRKFTILFTIIYSASCITKHYHNFYILLLGRFLGGIATSLLFSVFDSWLIKSYSDAGLSQYLSKAFSTAFYGNSVVAIVAGLIANHVASMNELSPMGGSSSLDAKSSSSLLYVGGYLNPFDVALLALILCGILAALLWGENYGSKDDSKQKSISGCQSLKNAFHNIIHNKDILFCGIISSLFEGSMYIFVFFWTPAMTKLSDENAKLPFGLIFSTFMVCCMTGSSIFSVLIDVYNTTQIGTVLFIISSIMFMITVLSTSDTMTFIAFLIFEVCVGVYFPMMGTMKSKYVPENMRSAIYNIYRIPLNFIVISSLLTDLSSTQSFAMCSIMLGIAASLQWTLNTSRKYSPLPVNDDNHS